MLRTASATSSTSCCAGGRADGAHSIQLSHAAHAAACSSLFNGRRERFGHRSSSGTDFACAPRAHAPKSLCLSERGSRFRLPAEQRAGLSSASSAAEGRPLRSTCASSSRCESRASKSKVHVSTCRAKHAGQSVCTLSGTDAGSGSAEHLGKYAAERPHVHLVGVQFVAQAQLGGAVRPRHHVRTWSARRRSAKKAACRAEVCDLDFAQSAPHNITDPSARQRYRGMRASEPTDGARHLRSIKIFCGFRSR